MVKHRRVSVYSFLTACFVVCVAAVQAADGPLALHPDNPHYLVFHGKPIVPIGSGEHYGAVLNLDFNFEKYLDELKSHGLTHTRTFSGVYCESTGAFNIARNTLAPAEGKYITPWARSDQLGYAGGGAKFDLTKWDDAYFQRLKAFVAAAGERGVIVELDLFCPFYEESMWRLSPMNAANNVNNVGNVPRDKVYTLDANGGLLAVHEAVTRKIVEELNDFDNLYFEICNEPYFGGVTEEWERRITDVIVETEEQLPKRHLISHNINNGSERVENPHPDVAILNFHYASPPTAVAENAGLNRVVGMNETGFKGTGDEYYRREAWQFLLAAGGLYSHLDYSFTVGHEDGTFEYPESQPGGGRESFRQQMNVLSQFLHGFDFIRMKPDANVIAEGVREGGSAYALAEPGKQYAIYLFGQPEGKLRLNLAAGTYAADWIDPQSGETLGGLELEHAGGVAELELPQVNPDVALRIIAK